MKIFKIIGLLLAAGATGAISCAASKEATDEITGRNEVDKNYETDDDITESDLTAKEI